jgi:nickel-dependent lactate racemase
VLTGEEMRAVPSLMAALREALKDPFGCAPMAMQAEGKENALVVVADYTRDNAYPRWLPELLNLLNDAGIPDRAIQLYVGSGTHRAMSDGEKREAFGAQVCSRVGILDHDCDAMGRMRKIGRTPYGTVAYVDERVYDSELLVITGGIQYHYFAGYSGGRKAILPGCAARETIEDNHRHTIDAKTGDFDARVKPGLIHGNPVHEDMTLVGNQISPDICVNVVLNAEHEVAWLGAGHHSFVLQRGAEYLDAHRKLIVEEPVDIAVIGAGGHPKDLTMFQAHKSLRHSVGALKDGATVVWLAQCGQGEGVAEFSAFRPLSLAEMIASVQHNISLNSFCALSIKQIAAKYQVHLVSELPDEHVRQWGVTPQASLDDALAALPAEAAGQRWLVAPDMSNLLPVAQEAVEEVAEDAGGEEP